MANLDNNSYRTKETLSSTFFHSCLGQIVILAVFALLMFFAASNSIPSEETMRNETNDAIKECIADTKHIDKLDEWIRNFTAIFTSADTTEMVREMMKDFEKYNNVEVYQHAFYSTAYIHNAFKPEGIRVAWGIFGIVIPTIYYQDMLLRVGPAPKEYNKPLIDPLDTGSSEDDGTFVDMDFGNSHDSYDTED